MPDLTNIVCGACKTEPQFILDAGVEVVLCLSCGRRDEVGKVLRTAGEQLMDSARMMQGRIMGAGGARSLGRAGPELPGRTFRWQCAGH